MGTVNNREIKFMTDVVASLTRQQRREENRGYRSGTNRFGKYAQHSRSVFVPANINRHTGKPHEHKREIARTLKQQARAMVARYRKRYPHQVVAMKAAMAGAAMYVPMGRLHRLD